MFEEKETKSRGKVNYKRINELVKVSHNVLNVVYILVLFACVYIGLRVFKELNIMKYVLEIIQILSPLFIGLVIAWLFNPVVNYFRKKGVKRVIGVVIIYILFLGIIALIVGSILPILYDQIIAFIKTIPNLFKSIEAFFDNTLSKLQGIEGLDIDAIKSNIIEQLEKTSTDLTSGLSTYIVNIIKALVSGISSFVVGLVIGFFFLLSFENVGETIQSLIPKKFRKETSNLADTINGSLRNYVTGVLIDATVVFGICSIAFGLIGLKAPLLFAVFCAITNVIPYVGPYIGAVPAVIVAFSMSPTIGILTLVAILVIQFFEGNFLQEYIMSKTTKLHPVTIIMGLLVFGHYWGIIGMVISTPLISVVKQIWLFFDEKYDIIKDDDDDELATETKNTKEKLVEEK